MFRALAAILALAFLPWTLCPHGNEIPSLDDDTTSSLAESEWFHADTHYEEAHSWAMNWQGVREYHALDLFGYSQGLARQFRKAGLRALAYDIKLSTSHDLTSREGFYKLLDMGMSLVVGAVVLGGPPCSLMVGASASVHMRRTWRLLGNQANAKVRLSNAIWMNMAVAISILIRMGRKLYYIFEQPAQSWGFKLPSMVQLKEQARMKIICTWMSFFGADLQKPTHLLSNLPTCEKLRRRMRKGDRARFNERLRKRNARRSKPRVYYQSCTKADGTKGWQGSRDLPQSAAYTGWFVRAIYSAWCEQAKADQLL